MTDSEKAVALNKAKNITEAAWNELCNQYTILEDMGDKLDKQKAEETRSLATVYLLGVIAQALLSK